MKITSASVLAILATGRFSKAECWQFTLNSPLSTSLYITNYDRSLTVGGHTYGDGFMLKRGSLVLNTKLDAASLSLDISPQFDAVNATKIGGYSVSEALRRGYFDNATVRMSKLFMSTAGDVSAGLVPWFEGIVAGVEVARATAVITIESALAKLNVAMPRNVYQTGCLHTLFDSGCTLAKASYKSTGAVTGVPSSLTTFSYSGLSQASGYFDLGTLKFTSGKNNGETRSVKSYGGGTLKLANPLFVVPSAGDTFDIYPGCDKTLNTCKTKFAADNSLHFSGYPYIPVPETQYDGGTYNPTVVTDGSQGRNIAGSATNAARFAGSYVR